MKREFFSLAEDHNESRAEAPPVSTGAATDMGEAECPQCGRLGGRHTKYCPHNPGRGESYDPA